MSRLIQVVDGINGAGEHHRHALKTGLVTQCDGQMSFAKADATEQEEIRGLYRPKPKNRRDHKSEIQEASVIGKWRITEMELWNQDFVE